MSTVKATKPVQSIPSVRPSKKKAVQSKKAPDGLPWPEGYFDRVPPKQTIEEATALYGVRPTMYFSGRPAYTIEESSRPEFKVKLPDEPLELQLQWRKECDEWDKLQKEIADAKPSK